jgi:hypothetical protein
MVVPRRRARRARVARSTLRQLVRRTQIMVVAAVVSQFQGTQQLAEILNNLLRPLGFEGRLGPAMPLYLFFGLAHFCASLVMPWTWKEASLPVAGIALVTFVLSLASTGDTWNMRLLSLVLGLIVGLPGILYSLFRSSGMRELLTLRLVGGRYQEVEHELSMARRIHERLFPAPIKAGAIRVSYEYEPMRQIGGDYLDLATGPDGSVTLALIDVTGHGVAAPSPSTVSTANSNASWPSTPRPDPHQSPAPSTSTSCSLSPMNASSQPPPWHESTPLARQHSASPATPRPSSPGAPAPSILSSHPR